MRRRAKQRFDEVANGYWDRYLASQLMPLGEDFFIG